MIIAADFNDAIKDRWDELAHVADIPFPFLSYAWIYRSWQHRLATSQNPQRLLLIRKTNNSIDSIAPLMIDKDRTVRFIADDWADYNDFIVSPENKESFITDLFKYLCDHAQEWSSIRLDNLLSTLNTIPMTQKQVAGQGWHSYEIVQNLCPRLLIPADPTLQRQTWQDFINKPTAKRRQNQLSRMGTLNFKILTDPTEIRQELRLFYLSHRARWNQDLQPSFFSDASTRQWIENLSQDLSPTQTLQLVRLSLDQTPLAYLITLRDHQKAFYYLPSINPSYMKYGTGAVLLKYLMESYSTQNVTELDFTRGDESYKFRYSNALQKAHRITIHRDFGPYLCSQAIHRFRFFIRFGSESWRGKIRTLWSYVKQAATLLSQKRSRLRYVIKDRGLLGTCVSLLKKTTGLFSPTTILFYEAKPETVKGSPISPSLTLGPLDEETLSQYFQKNEGFYDFRRQADIFQRTLDKDRCYGLWDANRNLVHYSWVKEQGQMDVTEVNQRFTLKAKQICIYASHTPTAHRGHGYYGIAIQQIAKTYFDRGIQSVLIYTDQRNKASVRGIEKSGFTRTGQPHDES